MSRSLERLVTQHLRRLAGEKVETENGETLISRAEKLALTMWNIALGTGPPEINEKTGKIKRVKPDAEMIRTVLDRLEGRVSTTEEIDKREENIPDKISAVGKLKINKISEVNNE